jgi:TPR repeat protein
VFPRVSEEILANLAAEQGDADSLYRLGYIYNHGLGVEKDHSKVAHYFKRAALRSHVLAQCDLGAAYFEGKGVKQDFEKAIMWITKAAEQGDGLAKINLQKMKEWLINAAKHGHPEAKSMLALAAAIV